MEKSAVEARLQEMRRVDGIKAIAPGGTAAAGDSQAAETALAQREAVALDEIRTFEQAGWTFVPSEAKEAREAQGDDYSVVVDGDGHLKILGNALNVKFEPALTRDEAERILQDHGLHIRRDLTFSPNLFLVSGIEGDTLGKARSLNAVSEVQYAEPVVIEPIGRR